MAEEDGPVSGWVKRAARKAGRRYGEIRESYREGHDASAGSDAAAERAEEDAPDPYADLPEPDLSYLPRNADGDARVVCRRHAEKRAVAVDDRGRPECFDSGHPDCEGCVEDVRDGLVETW